MTPTASAVLVGLSLGVAANNTTVVAQTNETVPDSAPEQTSPSDGGFFSRLIDPQDGRLDFTAAGGEEGTAAGLVPLLIPDNDPTFGFSLMPAAVYFHEEPSPPVADSPPTMTFGGAWFTENNSWAVGGGHSAVWNEGRTHYRGFLGYASVNLDYYGLSSILGSDPLRFNIEGLVLQQEAKFKIGSTNFFAGGRYTLLVAEIEFDLLANFPLPLGNTNDAGITAFIDYDTRDNTFTPNRGTLAVVGLSYFSESLGGDFDYSKLDVTGNQYWQLDEERITLGLRLEYQYTEEGAPFYSLPYVSLRGIPILRYLGNHVIEAEIEPRWKIDERWSVVGFAGIGRAADHFDDLRTTERAYNYGVGFRYLLARRLGLAAGFDIARGPEDTTLVITFGNAWDL